MKQTDYTTRVLIADEGMMLTQAAEVPDNERTYTDKIYLAVTDSPENWCEATAEEAAAHQTAVREAQEQQLTHSRSEAATWSPATEEA